MNPSRRNLLIMGCALGLLAMPAFAADDVIPAGTDIWFTNAARTFIQFAQNPIPADFFCTGSRPFAGMVRLKGVPLATHPEGAFGGADTIMQRLDDAVFEADGRAHTRIQFMAVSLVSVEPIKTACGPYNLSVSLAGDQPVSPHMTIVRTDDNGGYFVTEFDANFKLTFTPAKELGGVLPKKGKTLVMPWSETMRGTHSWANQHGGGTEFDGFVEIDTNGDRRPDTLVPGTTPNFGVGRSSEGSAFTNKAEQLTNLHAVCSDIC